MKKFVYPSVIYFDEEAKVYVLCIEDLGICVEGNTIEEVHSLGEQFLGAYMEQAVKDLGDEITPPTDFQAVVEKNPKQICMLVEATLDNNNKPIHK